MNKRKYNTDPELLLKQGKAIMSSTDEARYHFRVFAVNMVLSGCSAAQIGTMAGVSKVAVTGWVKTADEQGFEALRPKGHKGRPAKLTEDQYKEIDAVLQTDPKEIGYKNWDGPTLSAYISSKYNVNMSVRQCQRLFHSLGVKAGPDCPEIDGDFCHQIAGKPAGSSLPPAGLIHENSHSNTTFTA